MRREQLIAFRRLAQAGDDAPSAIVTTIDAHGRSIRVMLGDTLGLLLDEALPLRDRICLASGTVAGTLH